MASIREEIDVSVSPDQVWNAVRDLGHAHQRLFPGVLRDCRLEGDARIVTFADGRVLRELIVDVDDATRRVAWSAVGGRATHHNASIQVIAVESERSRVVWITDFLPSELAPAIGGLMRAGAAAMKAALVE